MTTLCTYCKHACTIAIMTDGLPDMKPVCSIGCYLLFGIQFLPQRAKTSANLPTQISLVCDEVLEEFHNALEYREKDDTLSDIH